MRSRAPFLLGLAALAGAITFFKLPPEREAHAGIFGPDQPLLVGGVDATGQTRGLALTDAGAVRVAPMYPTPARTYSSPDGGLDWCLAGLASVEHITVTCGDADCGWSDSIIRPDAGTPRYAASGSDSQYRQAGTVDDRDLTALTALVDGGHMVCIYQDTAPTKAGATLGVWP